MKGLKDLRKHERHRLRGQIHLSWGNPGSTVSSATANCLDVSVYGMLIESPSSIPAGTQVTCRLPESGTTGQAIVQQAMVRHCQQYGPWFRIGLRFNGALLLQENVPHIRESLLK